MKELKVTQIDGKIYHVLGLEESIQSKYHITQSNLQIQCNPFVFFFSTNVEQQQEQNNLYGNTKDPEQPKQS